MFFAPALNSGAATPPSGTTSGFGLERFMRDLGIAPPLHEIEEEDGSWIVRMDVPGVPRDQLLVQASDNRLSVETTGDCARRVAFAYALPAGIDPERIEAHLQDGVLTLKVAKPHGAVARRIEVQ